MMRNVYDELARAARSLGPVVGDFDRQITKAAASKSIRSTVVVRPPQRPKTRAHRPTRHRSVLPVPYARGAARTVLDRVRLLEEQRTGGTSIADRARRAADAIANASRRALSALRHALGRRSQ